MMIWKKNLMMRLGTVFTTCIDLVSCKADKQSGFTCLSIESMSFGEPTTVG